MKKTKFKEWAKINLAHCNLCYKTAKWKHPEGGLRCNTCYKYEYIEILGSERWRVEPCREGYYAYYQVDSHHKYSSPGYPSLHKTLQEAVDLIAFHLKTAGKL